jgi:hypothetical protein
VFTRARRNTTEPHKPSLIPLFLQLSLRVILALFLISICAITFYVMIKVFQILLRMYYEGIGLDEKKLLSVLIHILVIYIHMFLAARGAMWQDWFGTNGKVYVLLEPIQ